MNEEIAGCKLITKLKETRLSETWLAKNSAGQEVVLKKIKSPDKNLVIREAQAMAELGEGQPNIVQIYHAGEEGGVGFIIMEYMRGGNLMERIGGEGMKISESIKYMLTVGDALQHIHANGKIHFDVKPQNILFDDKGNVKLSDFGSIAFLSPAMNMPTPTTQEYAAPEALKMYEWHFKKIEYEKEIKELEATRSTQNKARIKELQCKLKALKKPRVDQRADIYSFGKTLYQCLTQAEFNKDEPFVLNSPRELNRKVPRWLDKIVMKALEFDPEDRYQKMSEMLNALRWHLLLKKVKYAAFSFVVAIIIALCVWILPPAPPVDELTRQAEIAIESQQMGKGINLLEEAAKLAAKRKLDKARQIELHRRLVNYYRGLSLPNWDKVKEHSQAILNLNPSDQRAIRDLEEARRQEDKHP